MNKYMIAKSKERTTVAFPLMDFSYSNEHKLALCWSERADRWIDIQVYTPINVNYALFSLSPDWSQEHLESPSSSSLLCSSY